MKKRVFSTLAIFIAGIFVLSFFTWKILSPGPLQKVRDNSSKDEENVFLLGDAELVNRLLSDRSSKAEEKLLELASKKNAVGYSANLALAERYSSQGKDPVSYYRQALELYDTMDVRKKLAFYLSKQGNYLDAANIYGSVLPDKSALESMLNLKIEPVTMGEIFIENRQWQTAEAFLKPEIEKIDDTIQKIKLEKQYAVALCELGQYKQALVLLENLQTIDTGDNEIKWWYGRSLEVIGQIKNAKEIYSSIGEAGAYRLGLLLEKEGNLKEAATAFAKSSDSDSQFRGARLFDEIGIRDKALEIYQSLGRGQGINQDDAAYRAYILAVRDKKTIDNEMLDIISKYPVWMQRLNKQSIWGPLEDIVYDKPEFLKRVEEYRKSGKKSMADIELSIGERYATLPEKLALGEWYLSQGNNYQAVRWGLKVLKEKPNRRAYELAYMRPFEESVRKAASEFNIDPNLLWGLMREESYFQADAVSRVGALGLMQLMPDTAKDIASRLRTTYNEKDLLTPEVNIRFGAYYLHSMLDMFSGDVDKALAAYNGGAGNVKRWSESKLGRTKEDFPTAVAFQETREYITKVSNSYYIYQKLYEIK